VVHRRKGPAERAAADGPLLGPEGGYLLQQVLFEPYPEEFRGLLGTEACIGRKLWEDTR